MHSAPLVELRSVHKCFGADAEVLRGVDLEVSPGDALAVLGPSGSGKSTLLNIVGGLLPPSSGQALFDGVDLATLDADRLAVLRNRELGFVFQAHHLLPQCSALENVLVPTLVDPDRAARRAAVDRARELLVEVGLGDRCDRRPAQLSGGECQRVAVVRALINGPRLILADEPTGSLDAAATDRLADLLCGLCASRAVALVTVTHSDRLASRMQRVLALRDGVLVPAGIPS
ncbi:MAG: ABC transporter ATP-binding protein [Planctomycetes bacterium]|nr:ABC transporter ATP-binding protein [Planctomycetota bacterium]